MTHARAEGDCRRIGISQALNELIVGNYLTTLGRDPDEDLQMLEDMW